MIPPKYRFFIARHVTSIPLLQNQNINIETGEYEKNDITIASYKVTIPSTFKYVYFKAQVDNNSYMQRCGLFFYDKDENYIIGYRFNDIYNVMANSQMVLVPNNAKYVAFSYSQYDDAYKTSIGNASPIWIASQVIPHYSKLEKKYKKEDNQQFFRESLDGKIAVHGKDFELIYSSELEDSFIFIIHSCYRQLSTGQPIYEKYFEGSFTKTDCKIDYRYKKCELKLQEEDEYTKIMNAYENEYDIIKDIKPEISGINISKRLLLQLYILDSNRIFNCLGNQYWESDTNFTVSSENAMDLRTKYAFSPIDSASELFISGSSVSEINGMYAGTGLILQSENGLYRIEMYNYYTDIGQTCLKLIRNLDNAEMYYAVGVRIDVNVSPTMEPEIFDANKHIRLSSSNGTVSFSNGVYANNIIGYAIYARILSDLQSIEGQTTYDIPSDDISQEIYAYHKMIGLRRNYQIFCKAWYSNEPTEFGINDFNAYFSNTFLPGTSGLSNPLPVLRNSWANAGIWLVYDNGFAAFEARNRSTYVLKDAYSVSSVINGILKKIGTNISHENTEEYSKFLYSTERPSIIGVPQFKLFITPITNILKGDYDDAAKKGTVTLKMIMDMFAKCFKCYWYIEDGKFKIEHLYFFNNGMSYNLNEPSILKTNELKDAHNKKNIEYFQSEIEYKKSDIPKRYEFSWGDSTEAFTNFYIDFNSAYTKDCKTESVSIENIYADIDYMQFNPSSFSNDALALLAVTDNNGIYTLPIGEVELINGKYVYKAIISNVYLSWANLIKFYAYDMPSRYADCNKLQSITISSISQIMTQTISMPIEQDLKTNSLVETNIGMGNIDEYSINIDTRMAKLKIKYAPQ